MTLTKYATFMKEFSDRHPELKGKELFIRAAQEWRDQPSAPSAPIHATRREKGKQELVRMIKGVKALLS